MHLWGCGDALQKQNDLSTNLILVLSSNKFQIISRRQENRNVQDNRKWKDVKSKICDFS